MNSLEKYANRLRRNSFSSRSSLEKSYVRESWFSKFLSQAQCWNMSKKLCIFWIYLLQRFAINRYIILFFSVIFIMLIADRALYQIESLAICNEIIFVVYCSTYCCFWPPIISGSTWYKSVCTQVLFPYVVVLLPSLVFFFFRLRFCGQIVANFQ